MDLTLFNMFCATAATPQIVPGVADLPAAMLLILSTVLPAGVGAAPAAALPAAAAAAAATLLRTRSGSRAAWRCQGTIFTAWTDPTEEQSLKGQWNANRYVNICT